VPAMLRKEARTLTPRERADLQQFTAATHRSPAFAAALPSLLDRMLPSAGPGRDTARQLDALLAANGFDRTQHEQIRADLRSGRIGLASNRLPATTRIEDVRPGDVTALTGADAEHRRAGEQALRRGEVAIVTFAAGVGSRW